MRVNVTVHVRIHMLEKRNVTREMRLPFSDTDL